MPAESLEEQWELPALEAALRDEWQIELALADKVKASDSVTDEEILEMVLEAGKASFRKLDRVGIEQFTPFMRMVLLQTSTTLARALWLRSTTCARASTCAATPRRTPSRNTSARPSSCGSGKKFKACRQAQLIISEPSSPGAGTAGPFLCCNRTFGPPTSGKACRTAHFGPMSPRLGVLQFRGDP